MVLLSVYTADARVQHDGRVDLATGQGIQSLPCNEGARTYVDGIPNRLGPFRSATETQAVACVRTLASKSWDESEH